MKKTLILEKEGELFVGRKIRNYDTAKLCNILKKVESCGLCHIRLTQLIELSTTPTPFGDVIKEIAGYQLDVKFIRFDEYAETRRKIGEIGYIARPIVMKTNDSDKGLCIPKARVEQSSDEGLVLGIGGFNTGNLASIMVFNNIIK